MLDNLYLHFQRKRLFHRQDIGTLAQVVIRHGQDRLVVRHFPDDTRHFGISGQFADLLPPVPRDYLIPAILTGAHQRGLVYAAYLDAFHQGAHLVIVPHPERVILERMELSQVDIYNLLRFPGARRFAGDSGLRGRGSASRRADAGPPPPPLSFGARGAFSFFGAFPYPWGLFLFRGPARFCFSSRARVPASGGLLFRFRTAATAGRFLFRLRRFSAIPARPITTGSTSTRPSGGSPVLRRGLFLYGFTRRRKVDHRFRGIGLFFHAGDSALFSLLLRRRGHGRPAGIFRRGGLGNNSLLRAHVLFFVCHSFSFFFVALKKAKPFRFDLRIFYPSSLSRHAKTPSIVSNGGVFV